MRRCVAAVVLLSACSSSDGSPSSGESVGVAGGGTMGSGGTPSGGLGGGTTAPGGMSGGSSGAATVGGRAGSVSAGGSFGAGGSIGAGGIVGSGGVGAGGATTIQTGGAAGSGGSSAGGSAGAMGGGGSGGTTACTLPMSAKGNNPLFTDQFTADPAPFVHDCTFYIQCGHDEAAAGQNQFVMREWFLLASTDMVHWTKNVALRLSDFKWANANAWAGQMVTKNGKFYWYVPVQQASTGAMAIGVAVADTPTGPFKDALGKALIDDAFEMSNVGFANPSATPYTIDPTVFVDDDGKAYLHYGGFGRMMEAKLGDDMVSIDGKMQEVTPQGFFEAAFLTKRNGTYYEIYAAGQNPATIDYATSSSPLGPWARKGRVLDAFKGLSGQDAPTNHSGVAHLGDQWFIVYHVSDGPNGGGTYRREVAVDKLTFNADGTIQRVVPSSGLTF